VVGNSQINAKGVREHFVTYDPNGRKTLGWQNKIVCKSYLSLEIIIYQLSVVLNYPNIPNINL